MELEKFNKTNKISTGDSSPYVSFSNGGLVTLNKEAARKIKVQETDKVEMLYDPKEKQWYIAKSNSEEALPLRMYKHGYLSFCHSSCVKKVLEQFEKTSKQSLRALVSVARVQHQGIELIPLIMKPKVPGRN